MVKCGMMIWNDTNYLWLGRYHYSIPRYDTLNYQISICSQRENWIVSLHRVVQFGNSSLMYLNTQISPLTCLKITWDRDGNNNNYKATILKITRRSTAKRNITIISRMAFLGTAGSSQKYQQRRGHRTCFFARICRFIKIELYEETCRDRRCPSSVIWKEGILNRDGVKRNFDRLARSLFSLNYAFKKYFASRPKGDIR